MKKFQALIILVVTLLLLAGFLVIDPFAHINDFLCYCFKSGSPDAKNQDQYSDQHTQETSCGGLPLRSLNALSSDLRRETQLQKVYLISNSQTFSFVLAPNEKPLPEPAKTYPDLVNDALREHGSNLLLYRLSAPNISYPEALWYVYYVTQSDQLRPSTIILQLNYEEFRKSDIRSGMLELLDDPKFRAKIEDVASSNEPFADTFREAIARYDQSSSRKNSGPGNLSASTGTGTSQTGISLSYGWGNAVENKFRRKVDAVPWLGQRHFIKESFINTLYLSRVFMLGIKPSSPRPLGGAAYTISASCVTKIADLCKSNGIKLELFNAPQNPKLVLYKTEADHQLYIRATREFAAQRNIPYYDFENGIPTQYWGEWIDGPDPIHFGLGGHQAMAKLFLESGILQ